VNDDRGLVYVVLEHFTRHLHPRVLEMQKALDGGACLSDSDVAHVKEVIEDMRFLRPLIARHPDHQPLAAAVMSLYTDIARRAWENETSARGRP